MKKEIVGEHIQIFGCVQGVGMRPSLWRLAKHFGLNGIIKNNDQGVCFKAWGEKTQIDNFLTALEKQPPPQANITKIERQPYYQPATTELSISDSTNSHNGPIETKIPSDAAACPQCLQELFDRNNRRYLYPFTNCTYCGPRYSITQGLPFDRHNTSMAKFIQCELCQQEYDNPADRRYHAQTNCCPRCGPKVWLEDSQGKNLSTDTNQDIFSATANLLKKGKIIAIKGIGGFHLACDASNDSAVATLRLRKQRPSKPLALLGASIAMIKQYAELGDSETSLLQSPAAPIVLLNRKAQPSCPQLSHHIAEQENQLGFMLPQSPLHHLLMAQMNAPLVFTSANSHNTPQCTENQQARTELNGIADYFLMHDREIINRCDDSVINTYSNKHQLLRRARGYAPKPNYPHLKKATHKNLLALGGDLKNTFCLMNKGSTTLSPHMGDLHNADTWRNYQQSLQEFQTLYRFQPDIIIVDQHPDYLTSKLGLQMAEQLEIPLVKAQHHHAHIVACMAEHQLDLEEDLLGIALDGLGMGNDDQLWGGEFLKVNARSFEWLAGLKPIALPGGNKAMQEPWRNGVAHLFQLPEWPDLAQKYRHLDWFQFLKQKPVPQLQEMILKNLNSPKASSAGRLFDATAAILGLWPDHIEHEGQAATALQALAEKASLSSQVTYPYTIENGTLSFAPMWLNLLEDLDKGVSKEEVAARFHRSLIAAVANIATELCERHQLSKVVLSGGVFQNRLLQWGVRERLEQKKLKVFSPQDIPANDGGISLGQALIGYHQLH